MNNFEQKQRNAEIFAELNYYKTKSHNLEIDLINSLKETAKDAVMIDHLQVQLMEEQDFHAVTKNDRANLINKVDCNKLTINALKVDVENLKIRNENQAKTLDKQAESLSAQKATIVAQGKELDDRSNHYRELRKEKSKLNTTVRELKEKLSVSHLMNAALEAELDKLRDNIH